MEILALLIGILFLGIGGFYATVYIAKLWTGSDVNEAVKKIYNFFNGKIVYSLDTDYGFADDIWENEKNVIGDKRFEQHFKLSQTAIETSLLHFGMNSGLPYVAISVQFADEHEKHVLKNILSNLVREYLKVYGFDRRLLVN